MFVHPRLLPILIVLIGGVASLFAAELTEQSVDNAVKRAVEFIKQSRKDGLHWEDNAPDSDFYGGNTGLALLSLLYAGEDPRSKEMTASLKWLADLPLDETYTVGTRAHVFALVPGRTAREILDRDVDWLMNTVHPADSPGAGAYGYEQKRSGWDNSNSQYGVLGVWMTAETGVRIRDGYWELIAGHWLDEQGQDGGWDYQSYSKSTGSMTAAGLATLFVVYDHHFATHREGLDKLLDGIDRGLNWTSQHFGTENFNGSASWKYYYLYGVERVGRASGRRYFRDRDWFRIGAAHLIDTQAANGSWPTTGNMEQPRNTCFALMFLCHGRAPVLFSKLEYTPPDLRNTLDEGTFSEPNATPNPRKRNDLARRTDWNRYPRDLAGLTRAAQIRLEKLLNWQIVDLNAPLSALLESPVLYMSGEIKWEFTDDDRSKLREYARRGGMLLAVPAGRGTHFVNSMKQLAGELFPDDPLEPLPEDHPLINGEVGSKLEPAPQLLAVKSGSRILMLISERDHARGWHRYRAGQRSNVDLDFGLNVYLYATDKSTPASRLSTTIIEEKPYRASKQLNLARIGYKGDWSNEPYGWKRFEAYLHNEVACKLNIGWNIPFDSPKLSVAQVAHITGDSPIVLSDAEKDGLRKFLTDGGTLIVDASCGAESFFDSMVEQLKEVLPGGELTLLPVDSPLITGVGIPGAVDISKVEYRRAARRFSEGKATPKLWVYNLQKQPAVILSRIDLSTGLLGTEVYGCIGYAPQSAIEIMRNAVLYGRLSAFDKAKLYRP